VSWDVDNFQVQPGIRRLTDEDRMAEEQARQARENNVVTYTTPDIPADAYPATLVKAMSAERTLAVQAELAGRPDVSVALLTWTLCLDLFDRDYGHRNQPLKASVSSNQYHLASLAPSGEEGKALMALKAQKESFRQRCLRTGLDFTWLLSWSAEQVNTLLGFCAAHGINGFRSAFITARTRVSWTGWKQRWTLTCVNGGSLMQKATLASSRLPRLARHMNRPGCQTKRSEF
jgi:ParB family chromosome partitioning protein